MVNHQQQSIALCVVVEARTGMLFWTLPKVARLNTVDMGPISYSRFNTKYCLTTF